MSTGATIDYDALAKQNGALSSAAPGVDYDALAKQNGAVSSNSNPAAQPGAYQTKPGGPILNANTPKAPPPDAMQRMSEVTLGTQHPWEDIKAGWKSWKDDPIGNLEQLGKDTAMVIPNMAAAVVYHPIRTAQQLTGEPQIAEDIKNKNYRGILGDVAGGVTNLATIASGASEADAANAARPAETLAANSRAAIESQTKAASKIPQQAAAALNDFQNAIPPSKSTPYSPADYKAARPYLEVEHGESPITASNGVEGIRDAADSAVGKIEDKVSSYIKANPTSQITTNPLSDVKATLAQNARGQGFIDAGMKELQDFHLDQPKTLQQADDIRWQLNQENKAVLKKNNYDVATARAADPGFAAREAAAESLRNGIYQKLDEAGIPGVQDLRSDEGSLLKIRNAAQGQLLNGNKQVAATAQNGTMRQIAKSLTKAAATGTGAYAGGPAGAIVGSAAGETAGNLFTPSALTKNELAARSFSVGVTKPPVYPEIPARPQVAGLLPSATQQMPGTSGTPFEGRTGAPTSSIVPQITRPALPAANKFTAGASSVEPQEFRSGAPTSAIVPSAPRPGLPTPSDIQVGRVPLSNLASARAPYILVRDAKGGYAKQFLGTDPGGSILIHGGQTYKIYR